MGKYSATIQQEQSMRAMSSTPTVGCGRGLGLWSEVMLEGVPMVQSPPDSPKATRESPERPMEESEEAREDDYPSKAVAATDVDEMPPLEVDEALLELDATLDEAGNEGEEGPKTLAEEDINEAPREIKDNPTLCLALGLTNPYWASMALVVGVRKLHEYEVYKSNQRRSQGISYGKLAAWFGINMDQLEEVLVVGKLQQRPKKGKAGQDKRVVEFKHWPKMEGGPPPPDRMPHRCTDVTQILGPFQDHHLVPKRETSFEKAFYRLSWSCRFNMENLS